MDLSTIGQVVGIVGGIIGILEGIKKFSGSASKDKIAISGVSNTVTKFMVAVGIVAILYGGIVLASGALQARTWKAECVGNDQSYNLNIVCEQSTTAKYNRYISPGLVSIGISFILMASAIFVQTLQNPSVIMFTLELLWLLAGGWLIYTNI